MYYNIFLIPSGSAYDLLEATVAELSRTYHGPIFVPHVTLLGGLGGPEEEVFIRTSQLAGRLQPLEINLTTPSYREQ